jgi:prevent-host-death family protein
MEVGVRELKAHLLEYLGRAAAGEDVVVTDRGRPVARLVPFASGSAVDRGIEEGWIEPPRRTSLTAAEPHRSALSVAEVLDEDRG